MIIEVVWIKKKKEIQFFQNQVYEKQQTSGAGRNTAKMDITFGKLILKANSGRMWWRE